MFFHISSKHYLNLRQPDIQILTIGILHLIVLCFIAPHRCCIFYRLKERPSASKRDYNLLYCDTHFIKVVGNEILNISKVCLYIFTVTTPKLTPLIQSSYHTFRSILSMSSWVCPPRVGLHKLHAFQDQDI